MASTDAWSERTVEFLDHVDVHGILTVDDKQALLGVYGPDGIFRGQMLPALRQAGLGNLLAIEDLSKLLGGGLCSRFLAFLGTTEGRARLAWAEGRLDARSMLPFRAVRPVRADDLVRLIAPTLDFDSAEALSSAMSRLAKAEAKAADPALADRTPAERTRDIIAAALAKVGVTHPAVANWFTEPLTRPHLDGVLEEVALHGTLASAPEFEAPDPAPAPTMVQDDEREPPPPVQARPKKVSAKGEAMLAALKRPCWTPVLAARQPEAMESRYGGMTAWVPEGEHWPRHSDGGPMSLVLQFDTDTLPGDMAERLGGRGNVFQLFVPFGDLRMLPASWQNGPAAVEEDIGGDFEDDALEDGAEELVDFPFEVRCFSKATAGSTVVQPEWGGADLPELEASAVVGWSEKDDVPFEHGGPYLPQVQAAFEAFEADGVNEESETVWEDKLGGWPALEQGPAVPEAWDHVIQVVGGGATGDEVAFDGHGWLVRKPGGGWYWFTVSS